VACPAGVEPATYGLEGLKNLARQYPTMGYLALIWVFVKTGVVVVLDGVPCRVRGFCRRLSGKPTFSSVLYWDACVNFKFQRGDPICGSFYELKKPP
jgi:hypothetical protein